MPDQEIDPAVVGQWVDDARAAIKQFLEDCEDVEYTASVGVNIMGYAAAQSARLRRCLMALEKNADALRYRKPS
jgi:hypothetical protein